jgi:hypothetical protein
MSTTFGSIRIRKATVLSLIDERLMRVRIIKRPYMSRANIQDQWALPWDVSLGVAG